MGLHGSALREWWQDCEEGRSHTRAHRQGSSLPFKSEGKLLGLCLTVMVWAPV